MNTQNSNSPWAVNAKTQETNEDAAKVNNVIIDKYDVKDSGPYEVFLEGQESIGKLHPMSIGKLLSINHKEINKNIESISIAGKNRIKVMLRSYLSANQLLNSKVLHERSIKAYIPQFKLRRIGIIKYVDTSLSEKELLELISPVFGEIIEVLSVKRFTKKIDSDKYLPTSTIMVTFRGQKLPSQVAICKVACAVEPYVQRVIQCFNCLRYGHVSKQCRSEIRCKKCGDNHHSDKCQSFTPLACIFCKGSHNATDHKICPEYKKQRAIKQLMATENISYKDAKIVQNNSYAGVVTLPVPPINNNNFPLLDENRNKRKRPMTIEKNFNFEEYNEIIRNPSDNSGNGVCLNNSNKPIFYDPEKNVLLSTKIVSDVLEILKSNRITNDRLD